jgi:hypothetical protein
MALSPEAKAEIWSILNLYAPPQRKALLQIMLIYLEQKEQRLQAEAELSKYPLPSEQENPPDKV